ncbi:hypothetical protein FD29_GL001520 [Companilactobacillus mindensis DSM 14500]|jgi:hypothetical protein|uniref:Uncharacterized protein n=2 Tax=Companilactobacillus mindensis TaxID=167481 RepID=A0A0R1QL77_9LACO|nr:hypothetical protein FD29_GL001520 [Companilactobacillus mindensis DSM 14500]
MKMKRSFARKPSLKPLFNSLIFGAAIGTFSFIILQRNFLWGAITGVLAFLIQSTLVYPRSLPTLYNSWSVTEKDIYYYDYSTWAKRLKAIFLPLAKKQNTVSFDDIDFYSLVVNKDKSGNKIIPHYIILRLNNGHNVILDLSWNLSKSGAPEKDVEWAVDFITNKLGQKSVKIFQV